MASFNAGTTFSDGVANDVTAAKLGTLVTNATPTPGFIQDRTAETVIATDDTLLIGDASDSNNLKRMTVANLLKAPLVSTSGTVSNLTTGTTTSTAQIVTSGTITNLTSSTANITLGTIPTLTTGTTTSTNEVVTNGTITNLSATTSTFLGAITASTNTINIGSGQIYKDSSGNVGIGTASPTEILNLNASSNTTTGIRLRNQGTNVGFISNEASFLGSGTSNNFAISSLGATSLLLATNGSERLRIDASGNVGIGTTSASSKLTVASGDIKISDNFGIGAGGGAQVIYNGTSQFLRFDTASAERLRIASSGQIGIGGANYGTSGQVLTSNGASSAPSWTTVSITPADGSITPAKLSQPLTRATAVTTSGTSISFTSIPSWARRITVMFNGISSNGSNVHKIRLGTSSGDETSGYTGVTANIGDTAATYSLLANAFDIIQTGGAGIVYYGQMTLCNLSGNIWTCNSSVGRTDNNFFGNCSGAKTLGGTLDRITLTTASVQVFDGGTINIMYEG